MYSKIVAMGIATSEAATICYPNTEKISVSVQALLIRGEFVYEDDKLPTFEEFENVEGVILTEAAEVNLIFVDDIGNFYLENYEEGEVFFLEGELTLRSVYKRELGRQTDHPFILVDVISLFDEYGFT